MTAAELDLYQQHEPLIEMVLERVRKPLPPHIDLDDLRSAGTVGLLSAVGRYDPANAGTFVAYAMIRIRGEMQDHLRRLDWCPRRARTKGRILRLAEAELVQRYRRSPTAEEVRVHAGMDAMEYARWRQSALPVSFVPIDSSRPDDDEGTLHDTIPDDAAESPADSLSRIDRIELMKRHISALPDRHRRVLAMYYYEGMRLHEIAGVFGLTESRICQLHAEAIEKLRSLMARTDCKIHRA